MKKTYLFILCAGLILAGCTSKEQDEKIKAFWGQQFLGFMMKNAERNQAMLQKAMPIVAAQSAALRPHAAPEQPHIAVVDSHGDTVAAQNAPKVPQVQVLDVTTEDDVLPGKARYEERVRMTSALGSVQENNQAILKDLQATFGESVKTSAFYITLNTERKLKKAAAVATDYKDYTARQKQILAEQDQSIKQLMQQNKSSLRRLKKSAAAN